MVKSIYQAEHHAALECLYALRVKAALSQAQLAEKLGRPQSFVSNGESGFRRLDLYQCYLWIRACGSDMKTFGAMMDKRIGRMTPAERVPSRPVGKKKKDRVR